MDFTDANMDHRNVSRCFFVECSMRGVRLTNADASDASFRELDMQDSDLLKWDNVTFSRGALSRLFFCIKLHSS
ncbi:pentapeptide repeat-containing protein [Mogibacterium sp. CM50]|uniref:pentapeptide repeat-containing protein n=1 Tax=Mogibacterium sp. CM50 TaxID=936375 RepID=UPI003FA4133A